MCDVCKRKSTTGCRLYSYSPKCLELCDKHERELFLMGETSFISRYYYKLVKKHKKVESNFSTMIKPNASYIELDINRK